VKSICRKYTPECDRKVSTALCALSQKPKVRCPLVSFSDEGVPPIPSKPKRRAKKPLPDVRVESHWKIGDPKPKAPEPWNIPLPNYVLYPWEQIHRPFPPDRSFLKATRYRPLRLVKK